MSTINIIYLSVAAVIIIVVAIIMIRRKLQLANKKKNGGKGGKIVKKVTLRDSIPYVHTYDNGIIETEPGVFTRAYRIPDINYRTISDEEQTSIFIRYGKLLNTMSSDVDYQIFIQNRTAELSSVVNNIQFLPQADDMNTFRREMNDVLITKMREGRNNITQDKILVVSVKCPDIRSAKSKLDECEKQIDRRFREISNENPAQAMSLTARLHTLFSIYNANSNAQFYNAKDEKGRAYLDFGALMKSGQNTKDLISPNMMEFKDSKTFQIGERFGRTLYLATFPNWLSTDYLTDLTDTYSNLIISLHYHMIDQQKAIKVAHNMMLNIDGQIADRQMKAAKQGYYDLIPPEMIKQQGYVRDLMDDMVSRDQKVFYVSFLVTVFGDTIEELEENVETIVNTSNNYMCSLKTLFMQQEQGFDSCLPLCLNQVKTAKMLTTESASVFIPYTTQELHQKDGLYYGINTTSKNMIIYNRILGTNINYNGLIMGKPGVGKSFAAKQEMVSALMRSKNNVVYVIDPEGEYTELARQFGGVVYTLSPSSNSFVNPLDMDITYGGDESNPIPMKTEFIISMIEIMMGRGRRVTPEQKSIISRCVQQIYRPYVDHIEAERAAGKDITSDPFAAPTLSTLHSVINVQPEPEAKALASVLEIYTSGAFSTFSHRTNIDSDARFIVYNVEGLGTGTKDLGIHICLNEIWNKMNRNHKQGLYTWFYVDEFYLLLQSESSASFVASIWKRARKRGGVPTGILQTTEDLLATPDTRAIFNTTSFIQILSLEKQDRLNIKEMLTISESALTNITDAGPGRGLIYAGKTIIPFKNEFPEDTELYRLMNTRADREKIGKTIFVG